MVGTHICSRGALGRLKPIVARTRSHHEFCPRSALRFIVIYKTDGGFVAIIPLNVCFVTAELAEGRPGSGLRVLNLALRIYIYFTFTLLK